MAEGCSRASGEMHQCEERVLIGQKLAGKEPNRIHFLPPLCDNPTFATQHRGSLWWTKQLPLVCISQPSGRQRRVRLGGCGVDRQAQGVRQPLSVGPVTPHLQASVSGVKIPLPSSRDDDASN